MEMTINDQDLDLSLLRTFLTVMRHGSMGRAAAEVAKTQPAVSQRILRLEKIIGQKLFFRRRDGLKLTGHGELLVEYANRAIDLNEEALARLRRQSVSGPVRIGVSEEGILAHLSPAFKRFQRTYPDVDLQLTIAGPLNLECMLNEGTLEFAISDLTEAVSQALLEWNSHPAWFASAELTLDPFCPLPLILPQSAGSWRNRTLDSLRTAGWAWRIVLEGASLDATIAAIQSGLGVSVLLREGARSIGMREVKHTRLPELPQVRYGLFRSTSSPTRAQSLMEATLAAFLKPARALRLGGGNDTCAWSLNSEPRLQWTARD